MDKLLTTDTIMWFLDGKKRKKENKKKKERKKKRVR
jgi:hypothetical protein